MNKQFFLLILLLTFSCSSDEETMTTTLLSDLVAQHAIEINNVIACASSGEIENEIIAYFYPRAGASDIRYFETTSTSEDKNDYTNYIQIDVSPENLFNGYLQKFPRITSEEKWAIITFIEAGKLHLSNPIRLKHKTQTTLFSSTIDIDFSENTMPVFTWQSVANVSDAIYFQVISDNQNNLLSGTYTFDTYFQYYNTDNVVLNITNETPPVLTQDNSYNFTLMAVSEDNWVNHLLQTPFNIE